MRRARMAFGLAIAVCALGAMAVPALAHEFVASKYKHTISPGEPVKTAGKSPEEEEGIQTFKFGKYNIKCAKAISKGVFEEPTQKIFTTTLKFSRCGYYPIVKNEVHFAASMPKGITMKFIVNGAVGIEGNGEGEEEEYGVNKIEVLETAATVKIPSAKFCTINIPTQQLPVASVKKPEGEYSDAIYSNLPVPIENPTMGQLKVWPGGIKHKVIFAISLKAMKFKFAEESQCGEDEEKTEYSAGTYSGTLIQEVPGGNLEFH